MSHATYAIQSALALSSPVEVTPIKKPVVYSFLALCKAVCKEQFPQAAASSLTAAASQISRSRQGWMMQRFACRPNATGVVPQEQAGLDDATFCMQT
eukprot:1161947-Pelagomonas_calceolata.AAC.10